MSNALAHASGNLIGSLGVDQTWYRLICCSWVEVGAICVSQSKQNIESSDLPKCRVRVLIEVFEIDFPRVPNILEARSQSDFLIVADHLQIGFLSPPAAPWRAPITYKSAFSRCKLLHGGLVADH